MTNVFKDSQAVVWCKVENPLRFFVIHFMHQISLTYESNGFDLRNCLSASELDCIRILIMQQLNGTLRKYRQTYTPVCDLAAYHLTIDEALHKLISPKRNRIFSANDANSILSLSSISQLLAHFKAALVSDEEGIGYPNIYWRVVRPDRPSDVGPLHRDEWFWNLNSSFPRPSYPHTRTKVWIPLHVEPSLNSLLVSPASHHRGDIEWVGEHRHGIQKPVLLTSEGSIPLKMVPATPGQSLIFHDRLIHGGSINQGTFTRVSFEFTIISAI
jgi:hypothetical protein